MFLIICLSMVIVSAAADLSVSRSFNYLPAANLDERRSTGRWYGIAKTPNPLGASTKCAVDDTLLNHDGTISTKVTSLSIITGAVTQWSGVLIPKSNVAKGQYVLQFSASPGQAVQYAQYTILATDYEHYIVTLMIQDSGHPTKLTAYAWIGSRTPKLAPQYYQRALEVLKRSITPISSLELIVQDC